MGPRSVATKQDRNSCSGTSAGSRERSSWVGIPNYKRVLSHNQTKSSIYVSDTSRLVIRWDLVYKNMGQALPTRLWKLPFITTWDDSRNQNRPTDSAEEAFLFAPWLCCVRRHVENS